MGESDLARNAAYNSAKLIRRPGNSTVAEFAADLFGLLNPLESNMAERVGFEPTLPFRVNTLSKRAPSATRPSLPAVFEAENFYSSILWFVVGNRNFAHWINEESAARTLLAEKRRNQEGLVTVSVLAGSSSWALPFPDDGTGAAGTFALPSRTRLCRQNNASSRRSATPSLSYTFRR